MNKVLINRQAAKRWGLEPQPSLAKLYIPNTNYQQLIYIQQIERIDVDKLKIVGYNIMGQQTPVNTVATFTDVNVKNTLVFTDKIETELLELASKYLTSKVSTIDSTQKESNIINALTLLSQQDTRYDLIG